MSSFRNAIRFFFVTLALALPLVASASTFEVKAFIDSDNHRDSNNLPNTGCSVVSSSGIVTGVEYVVTTLGTVTGNTGTVTSVTRQTCIAGILAAPVAVDSGWNVGVSAIGDLTIETHLGTDLLTMDNVVSPRFVFTSNVNVGTFTDSLVTPFSWGGGDIILPHAARDRAVATRPLRTIVTDGNGSEWEGEVAVANGTDHSPSWRFISAQVYAGAHDLYFDFQIHTNPLAPTAHDDTYPLPDLGATLTISSALGVLHNDDANNNQPVTATLVGQPHHGTVTLSANGAFTYVHDGSNVPQDQFTYVVTGSPLLSNVGTVTITMPGNNSHPYTFTSPDHVTFVAGQFSTFQVTVTGKPTPALTEEGALPLVVGFIDNGDGTGTLSGVPAPSAVGTYQIVFHAEKNKPHQSDQIFTLTIACPGNTPTITPTPAQVCANSPGNSAAGPAGATSYSWSIVNGTITSATTIQTITYTAGSAGTVGLTLTVTNTGCPSTNSINVPIIANPTAPITPSPAAVCANSAGNTAAGPAGMATYAWSIVNGTITSATNIQTITYTAGASGTVGLTLTVTNASGCPASNNASVPINPNPITPTITPTPASVCANSTGNSAAGPAGATTYAWSIVNGTITSATNIQTITYTAGASGTVGLTLIVTNASGCSASNTVNVTINPAPATPIITPTPAQVCASSTGNSAAGPAGATTYAWSIVNGTITSATNIQTITYTAGASGTVGLTLVVTNASGCSASNTANVTINANPAAPVITPTPAQVCANSTGNSAAGPAGATTYAWSIVNGTITSATNIQTITYTAGASGTVGLTLTVTNASGCSATNTANVTINPNPATPTITPTPASVCASSTGNSAAGPAGATTYAWSITNGTITSATNIQTITYTAGASGVVGLTLTVTNASGCPATGNANVTINPNPATPTITPTPAQVCANSTGNSAAGPAGATTYAWSIVNGAITSATNVQTITYTAGASGTVGLTLTVTNASGCATSNTVNVTINPTPATPTITPTPAQVCANSTGNTADGPAGATTYAWSIVNGTITSATNIQTITYTAGASGTVDLTLLVTNGSGCPASNTVSVTINANPTTPAISPSPATVCANSTGNSASGPAGAATYAWSITNGTITSATNIQTITYTAGASGTVGLTLVVTNAAGCSATNTVNVTINPNPSTPAITPTPSSVCANSTGNSAAGPAGATTYAWSIVNGTITSATNIQTITYTAGASGTVGLTLVVTNASGCSASNTVNVTINPSPATPTITPTPAQVCASSTGNSAAGPAGATTYAWSIVNGTITSANNIQTITYTAGASGTVGLTLIVTNASGCPASNTVNVTINANPATPTITPTPASVCANSTGNSAAGPAGATTYAWSITNGTITSATNIQTITYTAGASGTVGLTLVVTNASGCSASNNVNVTINPSPATPAITPTPAQVCASSTGNSAAGPAGATTYAWSIVNGTITSATNIQTITYTAGASGTVGLTLTVTNASGCPASNTVNVTINANPATPAITPTPAQVCASSTGNSAAGPAGAATYAWSITNGTITSATNIQTITYTAGTSGTVGLTLTVTNASGCSASNTVNVTINPNPTTPAITPTPAALCPSSTGNSAAGPAGATVYAWSITNGTITSATNIQTITYTAGASGNVGLTLVVTNAGGCSASNTVNVPISGVAPVVTTDPISQSVQSGTSVTFTAAASGTPAPTVQWQVSTGGPFTDISGATSTSLTFTATLSQNGNQYRAVFTNTCGTATTAAATLTVTCPPIVPARTGGGSFPNGAFNTSYTGQSFTATGGTGPYTFAVTAGTFPTGLSLASNGSISGTATATGLFSFTVTATDTATGCTGSAAFSISIAPAAIPDAYGAGNNIIDNVQFVITGGATVSPATPFVGATGNILTNDTSNTTITATPGTFSTSGGGSVTIAADGTFIYTPGVHAAAITSDSFTYTAVSNGVTSAPATVTLTLANRVWFVKNDAGAGDGRSHLPFNTLAAAQTASAAGDIIYVYDGNNTTSGQTAGITLKASQQLIGEGVALVVNTVTLKAAGVSPKITNTAATSDAITLANGGNNTVKGVTVTGATRDGITGINSGTFTGDTLVVQNNVTNGIVLNNSAAVTITNSTISGNGIGLQIIGGGAAVDVDNTNTITANAGQRSVAISARISTGTVTIGAAITDNGTGISVSSPVSGTPIVTFTGTQTLNTTTNQAVTLTNNTNATINFNGTLNITTTTGTGFGATGGGTLNVTGTANITTGAAASGLSLNAITIGGSGVTFNSVTTTGATTGINLVNFAAAGLVTVNGGTITNGATGVSLQGTNTSLTLAGVTITGPTTGITNTTNFGTLTIGAGVNVSGVTALNLTTGALNGTFADLSSTGGTNGVVLTSISGTGWSATTGSLAGATGAGFKVDGGSASMTYGGSITATGFLVDIGATTGRSGGTIAFSTGTLGGAGTLAGTGIRIQNSTGTSTFTFSGTQTLGTSGSRMAATAVTLAANNTTTTFNFNGTLSIFTGAVTAFTATGPTGGTINFSGTDSIDSSASALVLSGVNLGSGTLSSVTSAAGTNGISLTTVTGGTLTISGGSLSGATGATFLVSGGTVGVTDNGTISQATASQPTVSISGGHATGTITFGGNVTATNGTGLQFDNADGTYNFNGTTNSLNGGDAGIDIINGSGGTFSFSSGTSINNPTGIAYNEDTSTANVTYAGTITKNNNASNAVNINAKTGGTTTFSGAITGSTTTGNAIDLTNSGGTVNFSGALTLTTTSGVAFNATTGGVVNVTNAGNTISAGTSGTGINWNAVTGSSTETFSTITGSGTGVGMTVVSSGATNFTVGTVSTATGTAVSITTATGDFVFTKVSSNGAAKGMSVTALTGGGSFTVNGTGGLCDSSHIGASDCTGGSILGGTTRGGEFNNATAVTLKNMYFKGNGTTAVACNDDISSGSDTTCNAAVYLVTASTVVLDHVYVDGTGSNDMGILGNAVTALSLTTVEVANFTNTAKDPIVLQNLSGTCPFSSLNVHNNSGVHTAFVTQNTGTSTITFTSPTFTNNFGSGNPDQIQVDAYNTANITVSATNVNISSSSVNTGNGVMFQANSGSTMNATLNGGTVTGTNGILMASSGNLTQLTYLVTGLTNIANHNLGSNGITVGKASGGAGSVTTGSVTNNVITAATCGGGCFGIKVSSFGAGGSASATVTGNNISGVDGSAIAATAGQGATATTVIIQNNNIHNPALTQPGNIANSSYAIDLIAGTQAGDAPCFFVNVGDMSVGHTVPGNRNLISGSWQSGGNPIEAVEFNNSVFKILNLSGGAGPWISASNAGSGTDATQIGTVPFQAGTACP